MANINFRFEYDFELLALVSHLRPYQVAWHLGKLLEVDFYLQPIAKIELKSKEEIEIYWFLAQTYVRRFELVNNNLQKPKGMYLVPEFSYCDYLLKVQSHNNEGFDSSLLKSTGHITWLEKISLDKLKRADLLVFD